MSSDELEEMDFLTQSRFTTVTFNSSASRWGVSRTLLPEPLPLSSHGQPPFLRGAMCVATLFTLGKKRFFSFIPEHAGKPGVQTPLYRVSSRHTWSKAQILGGCHLYFLTVNTVGWCVEKTSTVCFSFLFYYRRFSVCDYARLKHLN
jgi:hypothetical protein